METIKQETSKPAKSKWRSVAINLLLFVVVVVGIRAWQQRDMAAGWAPLLQGTTLSGQRYVLPEHPAQPVLVHFWATWCPVCRAEQGSIEALAQEDLQVITVAMQSGKADAVDAFMQEQGLHFPVLNDPDGQLARLWGVHAVPASFIIAPDGQIRFVEVGYTTQWGLRLRLWLAGFMTRTV